MSEFVTDTNTVKAYADRLIRLSEQADEVREDIKEVKAEAKSDGIDVKALTKVVNERKRDMDAIEEEEEIIRLYRDAING
jgi:uncharacterized protein (UPF0335 family)